MKLKPLRIAPGLEPTWSSPGRQRTVPVYDDVTDPYTVALDSSGAISCSFSFIRLFEFILYERYAGEATRPYYTYLPFHYHRMPPWIRYQGARNPVKSRFPVWPMDDSLEVLRDIGIRYSLFPDIRYHKPGWPEHRQYALLLTHDIEAKNNWVWVKRIAELEMQLGFRSLWNVVPCLYTIDYDVLDWLAANGFEIGIHDYNHDNKLVFQSRDNLRNRIEKTLPLKERYRACGFRSASWIRTELLFQTLGGYYSYDMSTQDVDQICPAIKGGSCSVFPYYINGSLLEIPTTIPYEAPCYFNIPATELNSFWRRKIEWIKSVGGTISVVTHPDPHYGGTALMLNEYRSFLEQFQHDRYCYHALPGEFAEYTGSQFRTVPVTPS